MQNQPNQIPVEQFYKENIGLVHTIAKKGFGRLQKAGVSVGYEDVFQELSIVFLKAYEGFDPSYGFQFSTYYYRAAYNRLNSWGQDQIEERLVHGTFNIEELNEGSDEKRSMEDIIGSDENTPENALRAKQFAEHITKNLSPVARLLVDWTLEPPEELLQEIRSSEAYCEFGKSKGFKGLVSQRMNVKFIGKFLMMISDVNKPTMELAYKELKRMEEIESVKFI